MAKLLSALVGASMLGLAGVASAAEPVPLSDVQLDTVSAGVFNAGVGIGSVSAGVVPISFLNFGIGNVGP